MRALGQAGALRNDVRPDELVDRAWMLTGPELFLLATSGCGWSVARYRRWLAEQLHRELLA